LDTQHLNNKTWNSFLSYKFIYLFICLLFKYAQLIVVLFAFVGGHFSVITDQFSLNQRALIENNWNKWHGYHECTLISMCVCVCVLISNVNPISVQFVAVMGRHTVITVSCIVTPVSLDSRFRLPMMDIVKVSVNVLPI